MTAVHEVRSPSPATATPPTSVGKLLDDATPEAATVADGTR